MPVFIIAAFVILHLLTHDVCSALDVYDKLICGIRQKN